MDRTFQLEIGFASELSPKEIISLKEQIKTWFFAHEIFEFVEGTLSNLDLDGEPFDTQSDEYFTAYGGDLSPMGLFAFEENYLQDIAQKLSHQFNKLKLQITHFATEVWTEGWKDSFKPLYLERFCIYPPWEKQAVETQLLNTRILGLEIDPGFAFGTGQHATTQLCLKLMDELITKFPDIKTAYDVGCGSGILSIGLKKLGMDEVKGFDVDPGAWSSTLENAKINHVTVEVVKGPLNSVHEKQVKLVLANILYTTLEKIAKELLAVVEKGGFLVLSGIIESQMDALLTNHYLTECEIYKVEKMKSQNYLKSEGDPWVAVVLKKVK